MQIVRLSSALTDYCGKTEYVKKCGSTKTFSLKIKRLKKTIHITYIHIFINHWFPILFNIRFLLNFMIFKTLNFGIILWLDKSIFNMWGLDGRKIVWRQPRIALQKENILPTVKDVVMV